MRARSPWHQVGCMCSRCTPPSPADRARLVVRSRLIVAAIGAAVVLVVGIIIDLGRVS